MRARWVLVGVICSGCFGANHGDDFGGGDDTPPRPDAPIYDAGPDACIGITCAQVGATCGEIEDGCSNMLACGTCTGPSTCSGQGDPNACAIPLEDRACANGWCWEAPSTMPFSPAAMFAISTTDVWAVGSRGVVLHWDGTRWASVESNTGADLYDIWMASATDGWLVGAGGTLRRWNGTTWTTVASGTTAALRGVYGISASDVWIVGTNVARRWNGSSLTTPIATSTPAMIDVFAPSASNVFAVGDGRVWKYTGVTWSAQTPDAGTLTSYNLYKIVGTSTTAFALGRQTQFLDGDDLGFMWNGSTWTSLLNSGEPTYTDAFVDGGTAYAVTDISIATLPGFAAVSGPGTMGAATGIAGQRFIAGTTGLMWHGTPGAWIKDLYGERTRMSTIGAVGDDVWFGGVDFYEWRNGLVPHDLANVTAIAGRSREDVYVVQTGSLLKHYDGRAWTSVSKPSGDIAELHISADDELFLVGDSIHRQTASGWEEETIAELPPEVEWNAVDEAGGELWVAGNTEGASPTVAHVAHRVSGTWAELPLPNVEKLCGMAVVAPDDVWVVGDDKVSHWNGAMWTTTTRPGTPDLCAIEVFEGSLYVTGEPGDIHRRAPNGTWTVEPGLPTGAIYALRATATNLWAAGDYGSVFRR